MKITFLGTGAADWKYERHKDTEGYRRNSALLVNDELLIDPGPLVPNALQVFGKDAERIKYIINTHRHGDHYDPETVAYMKNAELYDMSAGEERTLGGYTVSALRANHSTCSEAVHFIISDGSVSMFYGLDGAWLMYDEVAAIKKKGVDIAVLDATIGDVEGDYRIFEHNNLNMVTEIKASLDKHVKRWVISHMARTLHTSHEELVARMKPYGIEVAYDGFELLI